MTSCWIKSSFAYTAAWTFNEGVAWTRDMCLLQKKNLIMGRLTEINYHWWSQARLIWSRWDPQIGVSVINCHFRAWMAPVCVFRFVENWSASLADVQPRFTLPTSRLQPDLRSSQSITSRSEFRRLLRTWTSWIHRARFYSTPCLASITFLSSCTSTA